MTATYDFNYRNAINAELEERYSDSRQRAAANCIRERGSKSILEIGCATNPMSNYLSELGPSVERIVTLEPNDSFFKEIQVPSNSFPSFEPLNKSLEEYAQETGKFQAKHDFIVLNCLLQEIEDPIAFLALVREVSARNALVWLSVPNASSIHKSLADTQIEFQQKSFGRKWNFDKESLQDLVQGAGLEVLFRQSRILKPVNDASILELIERSPSFLVCFNEWLGFKSSLDFFGAELDFLTSFKLPN